MHHPKLEQLVQRDPRYPIEAYEFIRDAILHAMRPGGTGHFSAGQLLRSIPELARREFGMLAPTVFRSWNLRRTADVGAVVGNLVAAELMEAGPDDARDDFGDADLIAALTDEYRIDWPRERLER
jgi:uncharacterized repeat protein (TIGR04138 family)